MSLSGGRSQYRPGSSHQPLPLDLLPMGVDLPVPDGRISVIFQRRLLMMTRLSLLCARWASLMVLLLGPFAHDAAFTQTKPRARDLGIPLDRTPGPVNAITDVAGVEVGYTTLVSGEGNLA